MLPRRRTPGLLLVPMLLAAAGCGGRSVNKQMAQQLIRELPEGMLDKSDVHVESISEMGGSHAIVEARLRTAFKLEKVDGKWVVREIRIANRPWESIETLFRAIDASKLAETRRLLEAVAGAIEKYVQKNGALPEFTEYVALSDKLNPEFLMPLVREDAWRQPLAAYRSGADAVRLVSGGPDAKLGTSDDVELTRAFSLRRPASK